MSKFEIKQIQDSDENPFDRQERISWWSQDRLRNAKIMIVGAGAIGNETLKNLCLLGIGYIFIVDFDTISKSNLSRTLLFRSSDGGQKKAEIAAQRVKDLFLEPTAKADWFHGDLVWELGTGIFKQMDLVLGCVDNVETRLAINRQCWLAGVPWIDAGIYELAGHISVFVPPHSCYQCSVSSAQLAAVRTRYSCDNFKRKMLNEGKVPTVQVTSAFVSSIQVQEALKLLCGQETIAGKSIVFQGKINDFDTILLPKNESCAAHASYPKTKLLNISTDISLREFLNIVSRPEYSDQGAQLDFRSDRTFVASVRCRSCSDWIELNFPNFRIYDTDTICKKCVATGVNLSSVSPEIPAEKITIDLFNLENTPAKILEMSLTRLGIPPCHILAVLDRHGEYQYYELTGDRKKILPNFVKAHDLDSTLKS